MLLAGGGGIGVPDLVSLGRRGEGAGFDAMYVPESWRSGFVPVTALAAATERVKVGAYVLNAHARTPLAAGMSAIDLDQASAGRFVLAVGSGNHVMNEDGHGVPVVKPLGKMRDYVELLRRVTSASIGSPVTYPGQRHAIRDWKPQAEPVRTSMPVLLAATAPKMMEVAAEVADGIALGALQSVEFLGEVGAAARKRSPLGDGFAVYCAAFVSADPDRNEARRRARKAVVDLFAVKPHPHYERLLREQGYDGFVTGLLARVRERGAEGAEAEVPDEVVDALTIAGTPADCAAQIARYRTVVDALILVNVAAMQQVPEGGRVVDAERAALLASYDALFELAETVREDVDDDTGA